MSQESEKTFSYVAEINLLICKAYSCLGISIILVHSYPRNNCIHYAKFCLYKVSLYQTLYPLSFPYFSLLVPFQSLHFSPPEIYTYCWRTYMYFRFIASYIGRLLEEMFLTNVHSPILWRCEQHCTPFASKRAFIIYLLSPFLGGGGKAEESLFWYFLHTLLTSSPWILLYQCKSTFDSVKMVMYIKVLQEQKDWNV
jgi:hypothetical protein